ncbi:MAG: hypothetical protein LQ338_005572 [Usnochroma carphineum]|nr:MAG: hypothetical protein LQ338_005572 [Usnochroma carphineum]
MASFLDELTSSLNATSASSTMTSLNELSRLNTTIITIIHQPRAKIFEYLDSLMLFGKGRVGLQKPRRNVQAYFEHLGFRFPSLANPADIIMDIVAGQDHLYKPSAASGPSSTNWKQIHIPAFPPGKGIPAPSPPLPTPPPPKTPKPSPSPLPRAPPSINKSSIPSGAPSCNNTACALPSTSKPASAASSRSSNPKGADTSAAWGHNHLPSRTTYFPGTPLPTNVPQKPTRIDVPAISDIHSADAHAPRSTEERNLLGQLNFWYFYTVASLLSVLAEGKGRRPDS